MKRAIIILIAIFSLTGCTGLSQQEGGSPEKETKKPADQAPAKEEPKKTDNQAQNGQPTVSASQSPLGKTEKIIYVSNASLDGKDDYTREGASNVWIMKPDGTSRMPLTKLTSSGIDVGNPRWSPDGTKILFNSNRKLDGSDSPVFFDPSYNIWLMNEDGTNAVPLTKFAANGVYGVNPLWSPDGKRILFISSAKLDGTDARNGQSTANLWIMNADGSQRLPLTKLTASSDRVRDAEWSPDGQKIVFSSNQKMDNAIYGPSDHPDNIWIVNADGSHSTSLTQLTKSLVLIRIPHWSPDGSKIIFQSNRALDGSNGLEKNWVILNIWIMDADGSHPMPLTKMTKSNCVHASWSPDGNRILFECGTNPDGKSADTPHNLWVMDGDGSHAATLGADSGPYFLGLGSSDPRWSPDGSKIIFTSKRKMDGTAGDILDPRNLWLMNSDATHSTPLTHYTWPNLDSLDPQWWKPPK